jgi:ribonuclease HI
VVDIRQASSSDANESHFKRAKTSANGNSQKTIHVARFVGNRSTNNQAEYQGVIDALSVCKEEIRKATNASANTSIELAVHGDSDLVIRQLQGSWQCRNEGLKPLHAKATRLLQDIRGMGRCHVSLKHVYRNMNEEADRKSV